MPKRLQQSVGREAREEKTSQPGIGGRDVDLKTVDCRLRVRMSSSMESKESHG